MAGSGDAVPESLARDSPTASREGEAREAGTVSLAAAGLHRLVYLLAGGAHRVLRRIPSGSPHLAAQSDHRTTGGGGCGDLVLAHVVGEAVGIAVVSGLELLALEDGGPDRLTRLSIRVAGDSDRGCKGSLMESV